VKAERPHLRSAATSAGHAYRRFSLGGSRINVNRVKNIAGNQSLI
jgi:hypothetical protein